MVAATTLATIALQSNAQQDSTQLRTENIIDDIGNAISGVGDLIPLIGCDVPLFRGINTTTMCSGTQMEYTINDNGKSVTQAGWTLSGGGFITQVNRVEFKTWFEDNVSGTTPSSLPNGVRVYGTGGFKKIELNFNGAISTYDQRFFAGDLLVPRRITFKSLYNTGAFTVDVWARLFGCTGDKNDGRTVTVYPTPSAGDAFITTSGTADCFKGMSLSIPNANNLSTTWNIPDEAAGGSKWNTGAYVQNFTSPGNKTISVTVVSPNGCGSYTGTRVVNVPNPPDVAFSIEGLAGVNDIPLENGDINRFINCSNQEYGVTLRANEIGGTVGNNAIFNWTLPQGWDAPGLVNNNCANGPCYSSTSRSIFVKAVTGRTELKGGRFTLSINTCNYNPNGRARDINRGVPYLVLDSKPTYTLTLPDITACSNQNVLLTPTASNSAVYPLTVSWESKTGWFNNYTSTISGANNGTGGVLYSTSQTQGFQLNKASGVDGKQCFSVPLSTPDPNNYQYTPRIGSSSQSSGWISGLLPRMPQPTRVLSNSIGYNGNIYFIGADGKAYFYSFDNQNPVWVLNTMVKVTNANTTYNSLVTRGSALFYINTTTGISYQDDAVNGGNPINIANSTGAKQLVLDRRNGEVYFRGANDFIYRVDVANQTATLYVAEATTQGFAANNGNMAYIDVATKTLKYRNANGTTGIIAQSLQCATELKFDRDQNLYYVRCGGSIFKTSFVNGVVGVTEQLPVGREGVGANGQFTINNTTGTVYYAGQNQSIVQIYKNTSGVYETIYATDNTTSGDNAGWSLVYGTPHLFYVSPNGLIYNLYYTDCVPKQFRKGDEESVSTTSNSSILSDVTFPNPFAEQLTVSVAGQGEANLQMVDMLGRVVLDRNYDFNPTTITTSHLEKGVYLCKVVQNGSVVYQTKLQK